MNDELIDLKKNIGAQFEDSKELFELLGDTTSIRIICFLLGNGNKEMSVEEITKAVFLSRPAVSHHIKSLKDAGILSMRKSSIYNYYKLNIDTPIWKNLCELFKTVDNLITLEEDLKNEKVCQDN